MVGEHLAHTILPGEDLRPVWRAACVAYREVRRTGARDEPAWKAARAAVLQEFPTLSERAAGEQASDAICYVAVYYPQWLWKGVGEAAESVRRTSGRGLTQVFIGDYSDRRSRPALRDVLP